MSQSQAKLFVVFSLIAVLVLLAIPALQSTRKRGRSQAYTNLKQIGVAIQNYKAAHGSFPSSADNGAAALYALKENVPATVFDAEPYRRPSPDACWNQKTGRIDNSDFEYLTPPDPANPNWHQVVAVENTGKSDDSFMVLLADGRITFARAPLGRPRDFVDTYESWDNFLIDGQQLFDLWQSFPPEQTGGTSAATSDAATGSIWNSRTTIRSWGDFVVEYEFKNGGLATRTTRSPFGTVVDHVTVDAYDRIVAIERQPENWRDMVGGTEN